MPCVFRGHAFAFKNVAQVPATVITNDLCAAAIRIGYAACRCDVLGAQVPGLNRSPLRGPAEIRVWHRN